ncbi:PTS fructose transporter subunit IIB [Virgibacillus profundi]|uniref:PTS fructose transporter subunit IIB n=1 Tax=Virgibacillus profundi TaxID=2024555 RepID=A0A2A2IAZ6_9BACI|nr:PTS fructose transporter subunit IIB [Virgibacillus profundi]PXY52323.1 PTS fructose transporter subunit IIB [Virgibacillus profundi]
MNILAVTACPAGVAHTYMAKKGLEKAAKKLGHKIKVETQGSMGIENEIKAKDLEKADLVILAIDTKIEKANRFDSKTIHEVPVAAAVKNAAKVIEDATAKL